MSALKTKHLLTGDELTTQELHSLITLAEELRGERTNGKLRSDLQGQTLVLVLEKPSLRTHVSFSVAMTELGGHVIESFSNSRKKEEPEDVARVLGGYCHGIMLRTHDHALVERMANRSPIPVINGLSDSHHPCQVFADLQTLKQRYGNLRGLTLSYIGDGNNMLQSLMLLMPRLGVSIRFSCPKGYGPDPQILSRAIEQAIKHEASVTSWEDPQSAVRGADAVYTDVWTSMGFEEESAFRDLAFKGYQLNDQLYSHARPSALIMHCMPMVRGKEITDSMAEHPCSALFQQSENRLHAQKALLLMLLKK